MSPSLFLNILRQRLFRGLHDELKTQPSSQKYHKCLLHTTCDGGRRKAVRGKWTRLLDGDNSISWQNNEKGSVTARLRRDLRLMHATRQNYAARQPSKSLTWQETRIDMIEEKMDEENEPDRFVILHSLSIITFIIPSRLFFYGGLEFLFDRTISCATSKRILNIPLSREVSASRFSSSFSFHRTTAGLFDLRNFFQLLSNSDVSIGSRSRKVQFVRVFAMKTSFNFFNHRLWTLLKRDDDPFRLRRFCAWICRIFTSVVTFATILRSLFSEMLS